MMVPTPWAQAAGASSAVVSHTQTATTIKTGAATGAVTFSGFSPRKGPMGIKVIITGSGFLGTTRVAFHGTPTTFRVISNTRIAAIVPCGAGSGRLSVRTPKGTARSVGSFKIT